MSELPVGPIAKRRRRPRRTVPLPPPDAGVLEVLHNRPFLFLWLAQVSTQVSGYMVLYGLTIIITSAYGSATATAAMLLSFLVPSVIFSAVAGVYVDQLDRRLVLVVTNVLRGVAFAGIAFVGTNLLPLYLLVIFVATVTTFFGPAEASMIPILVPRNQLLAANGLFTLTMNASFAVGFALFGPFVVSFASPAVLILIVAALYLVAAALTWTLPPAPPEKGVASAGHAVAEAERAVESMFAQLSEGITYIRNNPTIAWCLAYQGVSASLIGVLGSLGPSFAVTTLGLGGRDFVIVVLPLGLGIVTGILAINAYGRYVARRRLIEGGLITLGILVALLAVSGPLSSFLVGRAEATGLANVGRIVSLLGIVIVIGFLAGIAYIAVAVTSQTQLQEELREDARGRVFGILNTLVSIASFLPIIIFAPLADAIGTSPVLFLVAMLIVATGIASIVRRGPIQTHAQASVPAVSAGPAVDPMTAAVAAGGLVIAAGSTGGDPLAVAVTAAGLGAPRVSHRSHPSHPADATIEPGPPSGDSGGEGIPAGPAAEPPPPPADAPIAPAAPEDAQTSAGAEAVTSGDSPDVVTEDAVRASAADAAPLDAPGEVDTQPAPDARPDRPVADATSADPPVAAEPQVADAPGADPPVADAPETIEAPPQPGDSPPEHSRRLFGLPFRGRSSGADRAKPRGVIRRSPLDGEAPSGEFWKELRGVRDALRGRSNDDGQR